MTFSLDNIWTDEKIESLKRLWETNLSMAEIAKHMGVSRNSVCGKCHRLGLPSRLPIVRLPEEELRRRRLDRQRIYDGKRRVSFKPKVSKKMESPSLVPAPVYVGDLRIPFAELRDFTNKSPNQCRYVADEPPGPQYLACANETRPGESYCAHCRPLTLSNATRTSTERAEIVRLGTRQYLASLRKRVA